MNAVTSTVRITIAQFDLAGDILNKQTVGDVRKAQQQDDGAVKIECSRSGEKPSSVDFVDPGSILCVDADTNVDVTVTVTAYDLGGEVAYEETVSEFSEVWAAMRSVKIRQGGTTRTVKDAEITGLMIQ